MNVEKMRKQLSRAQPKKVELDYEQYMMWPDATMAWVNQWLSRVRIAHPHIDVFRHEDPLSRSVTIEWVPR